MTAASWDTLGFNSTGMTYYNGEISETADPRLGLFPDNVTDADSNSTIGLVKAGLMAKKRPDLLKQSLHMVVILTLAYAVVFFLAIVNNILVVCVICRNPQMRTVTNYFLANLAIADITVSFIVLPITLLSNLFTEWWFGAFLCKAIPYLQAVAVSASVNTLAAVALERYFAIFYPQKAIIGPTTAFIIIAVIWCVPVIIQVPWAIYYEERTFSSTTEILTACLPAFNTTDVEKIFFLCAVFLTNYVFPLLFIAIFYSLIGFKVWQRNVSGIRGSKAERNIQRSKIRIVRMLVTVAVMFAVSWLPLYSIRLLFLFGPTLPTETRKIVLTYISPLAQWMGSANSCVNPFIYCYFSEHFRRSIMAVFESRSCCSRVTSANTKGYTKTTTTTI